MTVNEMLWVYPSVILVVCIAVILSHYSTKRYLREYWMIRGRCSLDEDNEGDTHD